MTATDLILLGHKEAKDISDRFSKELAISMNRKLHMVFHKVYIEPLMDEITFLEEKP